MKSKKFLEYFDGLLEKAGENFDDLPQDVRDFYTVLQNSQDGETEKPTLTSTGLLVLEFLQQSEERSFKAKDIAEGSGLPSRKVSGAMRKLCTDGFVEKYGANPVNYMITTKGKEIDIEQFKVDNKED